MITEITMSELESRDIFLPPNELTIVMFFGATCGPCKATMPNYEKISDFFYARSERIKMFKINAWEPAEQKEYCNTKWEINGVPTFKIFFNGTLIATRAGGGDEPALKEMVTTHIDKVFKEYGVII